MYNTKYTTVHKYMLCCVCVPYDPPHHQHHDVQLHDGLSVVSH